MKKRLSPIVIGSFLTFANSAFALHDLHGFYINPEFNYSHTMLSDIQLSQDISVTGNNDYPLAKNSENRNGMGYNLIVGYGLENYPIRFELEYSTQPNVYYNNHPLFGNGSPLDQNFHSKINSWHAMANFLLDIHLNSYVTPYFKAGVGVAHNKVTLTDTYPDEIYGASMSQDRGNTKTSLAWQAGVGSAVRITDSLLVNGELRYVDMGKVDWGNFWDPQRNGSQGYSLSSNSFQAYQATVGLMWFFGGSRYTAPATTVA